MSKKSKIESPGIPEYSDLRSTLNSYYNEIAAIGNGFEDIIKGIKDPEIDKDELREWHFKTSWSLYGWLHETKTLLKTLQGEIEGMTQDNKDVERNKFDNSISAIIKMQDTCYNLEQTLSDILRVSQKILGIHSNTTFDPGQDFRGIDENMQASRNSFTEARELIESIN